MKVVVWFYENPSCLFSFHLASRLFTVKFSKSRCWIYIKIGYNLQLIYFFYLGLKYSRTPRHVVGLWPQRHFFKPQTMWIFSNISVGISDLIHFYLNICPWWYLLKSALNVISEYFVTRPIFVWRNWPRMTELPTYLLSGSRSFYKLVCMETLVWLYEH